MSCGCEKAPRKAGADQAAEGHRGGSGAVDGGTDPYGCTSEAAGVVDRLVALKPWLAPVMGRSQPKWCPRRPFTLLRNITSSIWTRILVATVVSAEQA